jgi:TolB-like protein
LIAPLRLRFLPFANLSTDLENDYFCDGLAEELLNALAKIEDLKVAARTSAFSFKNSNTNVSEIGRILNVEKVLMGGVRKSGNRIRITVQLVDATTGYSVWSERYDRELRDVFAVQDEITRAVVEQLKIKLFGDQAQPRPDGDDTEAYQLYLKGLFHFRRYTGAGWARAVQFFEQAIEKSPEYAAAFSGLASAGCTFITTQLFHRKQFCKAGWTRPTGPCPWMTASLRPICPWQIITFITRGTGPGPSRNLSGPFVSTQTVQMPISSTDCFSSLKSASMKAFGRAGARWSSTLCRCW